MNDVTNNENAGYITNVLMVDDDSSARLLIKATLESSGYRVHEAENGAVALEVFEKERPDIVLLDIMMPVLDGFQACKQIREHQAGIHIPIVMMTGLDDVESVQAAYDMGATDFVTKPLNYALLTHRLTYILRAKITADELRRTENRLHTAQRIARLGHWDWERDRNAVHSSEGVKNIFGAKDSDPFINRDGFLEMIHPDDRVELAGMISNGMNSGVDYSATYRVIDSSGNERIIHQDTEFQLQDDGEIAGGISTAQDITERKQFEDKIRYLSYYDAVTGLPNRALFIENLSRATLAANRQDHSVAVLCIELDNFRRFNETLGHDVGDRLLKEVAKRLNQTLRSSDLVAREELDQRDRAPTADIIDGIARLGGDEFVVLLPDITKSADAGNIAKRIIDSISSPFKVEHQELYLTANIGISVYPADSADAELVLKHAEVAMSHAKTKGKNSYQFYKQDLDVWAKKRLSLESHLRKAIENTEFEVHYQPRVDIQNDILLGMEALVRWNHPEIGMISPLEFIPLAEETGMILPIGEWVLRQACLDTIRFRDMGLKDLTVSINLSAAQFKKQDHVRSLTDIVEETGLEPEFVELELTEGLLLEDRQNSLITLNHLRDYGLGIAVDDFGTGYSSLAYLKNLPVSALKIDQSFVKGVTTDASDAAITEAIIGLAHSLKLKLVAEGVEIEEQLEFLKVRRCDEAQGYLICRPVPFEKFYEWATTSERAKNTSSKAAIS